MGSRRADELTVRDCAAGCNTAHVLRIGLDDGIRHAHPPSIFDLPESEQAAFGLRAFTYVCPVLGVEVKAMAMLPLGRTIVARARNLDDE